MKFWQKQDDKTYLYAFIIGIIIGSFLNPIASVIVIALALSTDNKAMVQLIKQKLIKIDL